MTQSSSSTQDSNRKSNMRWLVHIFLLTSILSVLITIITINAYRSLHIVVGFIFVVLIGTHLYQRKNTVRILSKDLIHKRERISRTRKLARSDAILLFFFLGMFATGIIDWINGSPVRSPFPAPFNSLHKFTGLVLLIYVLVHFSRRRKRLRNSTIR